jgi:hypothetical protein
MLPVSSYITPLQGFGSFVFISDGIKPIASVLCPFRALRRGCTPSRWAFYSRWDLTHSDRLSPITDGISPFPMGFHPSLTYYAPSGLCEGVVLHLVGLSIPDFRWDFTLSDGISPIVDVLRPFRALRRGCNPSRWAFYSRWNSPFPMDFHPSLTYYAPSGLCEGVVLHLVGFSIPDFRWDFTLSDFTHR